MCTWYIGVGLDAVATLAGTGGKQMLRYVAVSRNNWYYPAGLVLTAIIDPAFDIVAYSFAAQSIIAACAGLVVVWNVLLAPCTLNEELTPARAAAAVLICTGVVGVGVFGSHAEIDRSPDEYLALFTRPAACAYFAGYALWAAASLGFYCRASPAVGSFFLCAFGGSLAGNSYTTKAAVELTACGAIDPVCNARVHTRRANQRPIDCDCVL